MEMSEAFYITIATMGGGILLGLAYYFRSGILMSRCSDFQCCCFKVKNQPISEDHLGSIMEHEHPYQYSPERIARFTRDYTDLKDTKDEKNVPPV